jgi:hypothetical protein
MTRGEVTFPGWRDATPGTRVQRNGSGWTGTVVRVSVEPSGRRGHVTVKWDRSGAIGRVVAPAYDLTPVEEVPA